MCYQTSCLYLSIFYLGARTAQGRKRGPGGREEAAAGPEQGAPDQAGRPFLCGDGRAGV